MESYFNKVGGRLLNLLKVELHRILFSSEFYEFYRENYSSITILMTYQKY